MHMKHQSLRRTLVGLAASLAVLAAGLSGGGQPARAASANDSSPVPVAEKGAYAWGTLADGNKQDTNGSTAVYANQYTFRNKTLVISPKTWENFLQAPESRVYLTRYFKVNGDNADITVEKIGTKPNVPAIADDASNVFVWMNRDQIAKEPGSTHQIDLYATGNGSNYKMGSLTFHVQSDYYSWKDGDQWIDANPYGSMDQPAKTLKVTAEEAKALFKDGDENGYEPDAAKVLAQAGISLSNAWDTQVADPSIPSSKPFVEAGMPNTYADLWNGVAGSETNLAVTAQVTNPDSSAFGWGYGNTLSGKANSYQANIRFIVIGKSETSKTLTVSTGTSTNLQNVTRYEDVQVTAEHGKVSMVETSNGLKGGGAKSQTIVYEAPSYEVTDTVTLSYADANGVHYTVTFTITVSDDYQSSEEEPKNIFAQGELAPVDTTDPSYDGQDYKFADDIQAKSITMTGHAWQWALALQQRSDFMSPNLKLNASGNIVDEQGNYLTWDAAAGVYQIRDKNGELTEMSPLDFKPAKANDSGSWNDAAVPGSTPEWCVWQQGGQDMPCGPAFKVGKKNTISTVDGKLHEWTALKSGDIVARFGAAKPFEPDSNRIADENVTARPILRDGKPYLEVWVQKGYRMAPLAYVKVNIRHDWEFTYPNDSVNVSADDAKKATDAKSLMALAGVDLTDNAWEKGGWGDSVASATNPDLSDQLDAVNHSFSEGMETDFQDGKPGTYKVRFAAPLTQDVTVTLVIEDGPAPGPEPGPNPGGGTVTPTPICVVSFDTAGGTPSSYSSQRVPCGSKGQVKRPSPDPTREGFVFIGWYVQDAASTKAGTKANHAVDASAAPDGKPFDFKNDVVSANMTLVAGWTQETKPEGPSDPNKPNKPATPNGGDQGGADQPGTSHGNGNAGSNTSHGNSQTGSGANASLPTTGAAVAAVATVSLVLVCAAAALLLWRRSHHQA